MTRRTETSPYVALLAIAAAMLAGIALTGCGAAKSAEASDAPGASTARLLGYAGNAIAWTGEDPGGITSAVLVDQYTGVEYLVIKYVGIERGGVSVTPLLDADGTPRRTEEGR